MTQIAHTRSAGGAANAARQAPGSRPAGQQAAADGPQQYLTFLLGGEMFAVGILNVKEIIEYGNLTEIPMMPPFIRGVINLRGSVVPVIDLSARFGHAQSQVGKRTCIVIVEVTENDCATTSASWSMRSPRCSRSPAAKSSRHLLVRLPTRIRADFIFGMGKVAASSSSCSASSTPRCLSVDRRSRSSGVAHTAQPFLTRANPIPGLGHWNWSEAITGLRRDDIVGRCAHEVLPQVESRWIERFGAVALTGDCQAFDDFSSDLDRRYRVTAYRPASGQFALIIDDITALRRGEESPAPLAPRCDCEALTGLAIERMPQASHLRAAIEDGDLRLDYQPLIAAGSGQVIGSEALLHWRHPARFIAVAEDRGLIAPLAAWLLASACRQMKTWLDAGRALRTVAVKLSPQQFFLRDLPELVGQTLAATGLEAHFLELEISAGTLAEHGDQVAATLGRLRQLGVRLASDDFGSASASPTDLRRYPIDTLKIDRSFIRDIATDAGDAHIAAAIIAMAHSLKLSVIAEGVESAAQFALLEEHGCDYYQGPLFGRPLPAEEFPEHAPVLG
jgi:EAL domain-containing protein (putative c-di-GMP-specific phosphodiesterase class I)